MTGVIIKNHKHSLFSGCIYRCKQWIDRPESMAVSLLIQGEDVEFWQKLSKGIKAMLKTKHGNEILQWMPQ